MSRGKLTEEINEYAEEFLGRKITKAELRLYPYMDYCLKNDENLDPIRMNQDDRDVLSILRKEEHIVGGASDFGITKEFYNYIQEVLWMGYVNYEV